MIEKISINKFKIIESLVINKLTNINYFIGENGSGKSSILELLSICLGHRSGNNGNIDDVFKKTYGTTNVFDGGIGKLKITIDNNVNLISEMENKNGTINFISEINPHDKNIQCDYYNPAIINPNIMVPITPFMESEITNEPYIDPIFYTNLKDWKMDDSKIKDFFNNIIGMNQNEVINNNISDIRQLSTGYKSLLNLFLRIHIFLEHIGNSKEKFFLIEEPEYGLHAKFQRLFSKTIEYFKSYNIQFFISTHSSVLINEAKKYNNSKIWFLKNGCTIDLNHNLNKGENGFLPFESVGFSASLMGIENEDFGYPENFCLVEESSIIELLKPIFTSEKSFLKNIFYVAVNGESKFENYDNSELQKFKSQDTLIKCNPFYSDSYLLIVDKYKDKSINKKLVRYLENRKERMNKNQNRFFELSKDGIEDYYGNNENLYKLIKDDIEQLVTLKGQELGKLKASIAKSVGEYIIKSENSEFVFSELFENELDILIKST